jgi:hypothetical protein
VSKTSCKPISAQATIEVLLSFGASIQHRNAQGKLVFDVCTPGSRVGIQRLIQSTINKNKHQTWGGRADVVASKVTTS